MASTPDLPGQADSATQQSSTLSDTNPTRTDNIAPKAPTTSPSTTRRKASTKPAPPFSMKRAASTPNVRTMAGAEALAVSIAEKRRNKLGYHRTSVACGHCRRRKIRCLLALEDPHGKCQNCIRLKKECTFLPVEQHPELDERPRSDSKLDMVSNGARTSNSSSPSFTGSRVAEHLDDPSQAISSFSSSGLHPDARAVGTLSRSLTNPPSRSRAGGSFPVRQSTDPGAVHMAARPHDTFPTYEQNMPWTSSFIQQSPQSLATERAPAEELQYWRHDPSMPTAHPQHSYSMMPSAASLAHSSQAGMDQDPSFGYRDPHSWSDSPHPPLRSTSLVGPDELPVQYQNQYYQNATDEFHPSTNASDMPPPTLSSNNSTMSGSDLPLSLPGMGFFHDTTPHHMNYVYPSNWSSATPTQNQQISGSASDRFVHGWYADPSGLAQVKEDEVVSQFHHSTPPDNLAYQANPG